MLFGLILSQLIENLLHRYYIFWIPGSSADVLVGIIIGIISKSLNESEKDELLFHEHFFSYIFFQ